MMSGTQRPGNWARMVLIGPFGNIEAGFVPPDIAAAAQIVWSGWFPWGFDAWLYEWHGERTMNRGRTDALIYRRTGRRLAAAEIPPLVGEDTEMWADGAAMIVEGFDVPAELIWPGL